MEITYSFTKRFHAVKQIPIFSKLNWFDIQKIARKVKISHYKKGDILRREGDAADFFFCVLSGRVQAYTAPYAGVKNNVDFLHRGMFFGIISVFTGKNHSMSFEAMNDTVVLKIDKEDFHVILKSVPRLGVEFSQELSKRLRRKVKRGQGVFESQIISVYSSTKGIGTSTYAFNLALSLAQETKKNVIFLNINSKQKWESDFKDQGSVFVCDASLDIKEASADNNKMHEAIIRGKLDIDFLGISFDVDIKKEEPIDKEVIRKIAPLVSSLVGDYHYVVVDLPNQMDDLVLETLTQSDCVYLLTIDTNKDLLHTRKVIDSLESTLKERFKEDKIKVIVSNIASKDYLSFEKINDFIDYHIHSMLPFMEEHHFVKTLFLNGILFHKCPAQSEYAQKVKHIAREIGQVLVGLVLGGGAALGIAHIGVIRVLEEEGIPIDVVAGSSMGALIGSLWVTGKSADEMEKISYEFKKKIGMLKLLDPVLPISGVIGGNAIKRWLKKYLGDRTFYASKIPFKVIAYDLNRREDIVINGGFIIDAVRKSIAIPGVIEPIKTKDQLIIDGGVLNPLPTNVMAGLGIKKIISVNVLQSPENVSEGFEKVLKRRAEQEKIKFFDAPWGYIKYRIGRILSKIFSGSITEIIVMALQASEYEIAVNSEQIADVNIRPNLSGIDWYELYKVEDLIERGEKATRELLPEIRKLIEE